MCVCVCVYSAKTFSVLSLSHLPSFSLSFSFSTCLFYTISILLASTFRIFYFIFLFSSFFVDILRLFCPDDYIPEDSPVRILDAFVNSLNLEELGYTLLLKETFREGLTKLMLKQLLLATNIFVLTVPVALIFTNAPILLMAEELQETLIKIS